MRQTLFKTVHGSRLYGLAHADSDEDFYTVVTKKPYTGRGQGKAKFAKQTIVGDEDSMLLDMGTWIEQCRRGVPQALEAMFSQQPIEDNIASFRAGYRAGTEVYSRYFRTIKSFALQEEYKKKRHALRLALNLNEMARTGRFNPTLSPEDAAYVSLYATKGNDDVYGLARCIAW